MFKERKTSLFEVPAKVPTKSSNAFVNAGLSKSAETLSVNGALKYSTTGNDFVDQFGKLSSFKELRNFEDISNDCFLLYSQNPKLAVSFIFYIRMITRTTFLFDGSKTETTQRGSGLKHEGIMRMIWLHTNHPDIFWKNINLYISIASWKDVFQMLQYDLEFHGWESRKLNWNNFGNLILTGLENPNTINLVKKYLPQIQSRIKCTTIHTQADTIIGKWICSLLNMDYKSYRKLKSSGEAHTWQQLISKKLFDSIDFSSIHGRALALMTSSKFISNNNLTEKYTSWIMEQPVAKYTGYVHELLCGITHNLPDYKVQTINKQFYGLVETGKKNANTNTGLIVVRDTSASMARSATGTKLSCFNIAKALAVYFSEFLTGYFSNSWIEFNSTAKMHTWKGNTPVEKWINDNSSFIGSTNFQSVIDLFVQIKNSGVTEDSFPNGIICISDSEFNPTQLNNTNVSEALNKLMNGGFSEEYIKKFKIVLWNLQSSNHGGKFETYGNVENVYYFSGYEASTLAFLTGVDKQVSEPKNAEELFDAAMNQEILNMITI